MTVDFTKFPYPRIDNPAAGTVTEAITAAPDPSGFVVITLKAADPGAIAAAIRDFVRSLRANSKTSRLKDITAYRQLERSELGGAVPFDQPICEGLITRRQSEQSRPKRLRRSSHWCCPVHMRTGFCLLVMKQRILLCKRRTVSTAARMKAWRSWRLPCRSRPWALSET